MTGWIPTKSKTWSTPRPPVISATASAASVAVELTVWVAPNARAVSSLSSATSIAMIVAAPAMRAPLIALMPTPPVPMIAIVSPAWTSAVLMTAPAPVITRSLEGLLGERDVGGDLGELVLVDEGVFGEAAEAHALGERVAVCVGDACRLLRVSFGGFGMLAEVHLAGEAAHASAAILNNTGNDVVADDEVRHLGTYRSDDSGNLMPEHRGHVGAEVGLGGKFIAVTETRGLNVDENFTPEGSARVTSSVWNPPPNSRTTAAFIFFSFSIWVQGCEITERSLHRWGFPV